MGSKAERSGRKRRLEQTSFIPIFQLQRTFSHSADIDSVQDSVTGTIRSVFDRQCEHRQCEHFGIYKPQRGPSTGLSQLAVAVWSVAAEYGLALSSRHIAGVSSTEADRLSRSPDTHNWMLHAGLFSVTRSKAGSAYNRPLCNISVQIHGYSLRFGNHP